MNDDVFQYIPKDKFDKAKIQDILNLSGEDIQPILYQLLVWLQDMNWPVAEELINILPKFHKSLIPLIKQVLSCEQKDGVWKYWIISCLLPKFPKESIAVLISDIERIALNATESEILEEVGEVATEFLEKYFKN